MLGEFHCWLILSSLIIFKPKNSEIYNSINKIEMKHTAKAVNDQSNHIGYTMTTPFNSILNPSTGKMVLSGGRVGSKVIKNYTTDTILNPKSKKLGNEKPNDRMESWENILETYKMDI